ncbi:calcium-binding protein [Ruminococcus sp.]|uniref:calcium-binding protein n=1 Tax=Ruminococcus sp. TaxID=41978 RepID=UPI0025EE571C|nr:calcium-binding protein [Ruminococcus sp.]
MADKNNSDLWEEYNKEVIEKTKGLAKEKAEEKGLELAIDFIEKHTSEEFTGMDGDTYKLVYKYIKDGTITSGDTEKQIGALVDIVDTAPGFKWLTKTDTYKSLKKVYDLWDKYGDRIKSSISEIKSLNADIEEHGMVTASSTLELEGLMNNFIDTTEDLCELFPGGDIFGDLLDDVQEDLNDILVKNINERAKYADVSFFYYEPHVDDYLDEFEHDYFVKEINLWGDIDDKWKEGPSLERMQRLYAVATSPESQAKIGVFDRYVEYRFTLEAKQLLLDFEMETGIDASSAKKDKKSIWEKAKEGIEGWNNYWQGKGEKLYDKNSAKFEKIKKGIGNLFNTDSAKLWSVKPIIISSWKSAGSARYVVDPLIFDLDDDGFNITDKSNGAYFDKDNNGYKERIDWTNTDAFLALDRNGNGKIDNGTELFGDTTYIEGSEEYAENGFAALQQYDENGDGIIDSRDSVYDDLRLWVDANGDGVSEESELSTLAEHGITSISAVADEERINTGTDAVIDGTSTFTYEDGTAGRFGALWATANYYDTKEESNIEYEGINTAQMGNMPSLANALANDDGTLQGYIDDFKNALNYSEKMENLDNILFTMSGAQNIAEKSRGSNIDARKLHVIETIMGEKFSGVNGADPNPTAANMLKNMYNSISDVYYAIFNIDVVKPYLDEMMVAEFSDGRKKYYTDDMCLAILNEMVNNPDTTILTDVCKYLATFGVDGEVNYDVIIDLNDFFSYDEASSVAVSKEFTAHNIYIGTDSGDKLNGSGNADKLFGGKGNDTLYGGNGDDELHGGAGNDTLYGGYGNDTYMFNLGDGQDTINEENVGSTADKVVFGTGIKPEDITVTRDGNDMVLLVGTKGDSLRIVRQYTNSGYQVENFEFADGKKAHIDLTASEFVIEPEEETVTVEQTAAEYLSDLYTDDVFSGELTVDNTVISEVTDSMSIGNESDDISDIANIQAMVLAENMSAFSNESQISGGINISDITSDSSALDQLLVNTSMQ